jgi:hypothetical protein
VKKRKLERSLKTKLSSDDAAALLEFGQTAVGGVA